jgi:hypothetical protein
VLRGDISIHCASLSWTLRKMSRSKTMWHCYEWSYEIFEEGQDAVAE